MEVHYLEIKQKIEELEVDLQYAEYDLVRAEDDADRYGKNIRRPRGRWIVKSVCECVGGVLALRRPTHIPTHFGCGRSPPQELNQGTDAEIKVKD